MKRTTGKMTKEEILEIDPRYARGAEFVNWEQLDSFLNTDAGHSQTTASQCSLSREWFDKEWYPGSVLYYDGLALYSIIRTEMPTVVVELGGFMGMSTCFIANAMDHGNAGKIYSVDLYDTDNSLVRHIHGVDRGHTIRNNMPKDTSVTLIAEDAITYMATQAPETVDFIFEDTDHTYNTTLQILQNSHAALKPNGVIVSHDAHIESVQQAYFDVFGKDVCTILDSGIILWRKA
jgi:predicted O-methyltransferase YrrM